MKNHGVVYNGKVCKNMGPKRIRKNTSCKKSPCLCTNGPLQGETLWFGNAGLSSAVFTYRGETGRYVCGEWVKS